MSTCGESYFSVSEWKFVSSNLLEGTQFSVNCLMEVTFHVHVVHYM